jgi:voltage-gated potassium channel
MEIKKIGWALLLVFSILAIGVGGYMAIEGWNLFDSLYMVTITLATVGFSEVHPLSFGGRMFTIILIFVWACVGVYALGSVFRPIVEGEMRKVLGRRKLEKEIKTIKDHYIICGFGRMGGYISKELKGKSVPYIIIEKDEAAREKLEREHHLYLYGDATEDEMLTRAGVKDARGLVAVVASDADNVYITLTARELNPKLFIIARSTDESSERKLMQAGANKVISPYQMGAVRMVQAILRPAVVDFLEIAFHGKSMELQCEELTVKSNSSLAGRSLKEAEVRKNLGVIIVAVKEASGKMIFNPSPDARINSGDTLITLGEAKDLVRLEKFVQPS